MWHRKTTDCGQGGLASFLVKKAVGVGLPVKLLKVTQE